MRDHDDEAVFGDLFQDLHHLHARLAVERAGRLVGEQNVRIVDERPRDGDALHLAARHLVRLFVELIAEANALKRPDRALAALALAHARERERQLHVAQHRLVRDQIIALEDEADGVVAVAVPVGVGKVLRRFAIDDKVAARVLIQPADNVQKRRLAAARMAEDGDKLALAEVEAHAPQRMDGSIARLIILDDLLQLQHILPSF